MGWADGCVCSCLEERRAERRACGACVARGRTCARAYVFLRAFICSVAFLRILQPWGGATPGAFEAHEGWAAAPRLGGGPLAAGPGLLTPCTANRAVIRRAIRASWASTRAFRSASLASNSCSRCSGAACAPK